MGVMASRIAEVNHQPLQCFILLKCALNCEWLLFYLISVICYFLFPVSMKMLTCNCMRWQLTSPCGLGSTQRWVLIVAQLRHSISGANDRGQHWFMYDLSSVLCQRIVQTTVAVLSSRFCILRKFRLHLNQYTTFCSRKCIWKYRLQTANHFV